MFKSYNAYKKKKKKKSMMIIINDDAKGTIKEMYGQTFLSAYLLILQRN